MSPWLWITLIWLALLLLIWAFLYGATRKRTSEEQLRIDSDRKPKIPRHEEQKIYSRVEATLEARDYQARTGLPVHVYVCIASGVEHYHVCKIPKGAHWHSGK